MQINVVEIFDSIDGEGVRTGRPVTFIRLANCNLRCSYCDTCYAQEKENGVLVDIDEVVKQVNFNKVTLTGGEPLLQQLAVIELIKKLKGREVSIETNGSVDLTPFLPLRHETGCFFTMDYKLDGSGMEGTMNLNNLFLLNERDVLKFVVSDTKEFKRIAEILMNYPISCPVFISPCFERIYASALVEEVKKLQQLMPNKDMRVQVQLHKILWDPQARGV